MDINKYIQYSGEISPRYPKYAQKMERITEFLSASPINVTAISRGNEVLTKHIIDSLRCASEIEKAVGENPSGITICDVGSGGGFPALPIAAVLPESSVTAMDSTSKKCRFIEQSAENAHIVNIKTLSLRAEDATEHFNTFDIVTARAVASLPILLEICSPLVKVGGYFLAMKGDHADEELAISHNAAKKLNTELVASSYYTLPEDAGKRAVFVYKKNASTPKGYPREYRRIAKSPL